MISGLGLKQVSMAPHSWPPCEEHGGGGEVLIPPREAGRTAEEDEEG